MSFTVNMDKVNCRYLITKFVFVNVFATKWRSSLHQVQNEVSPFSGWQWMTFLQRPLDQSGTLLWYGPLVRPLKRWILPLRGSTEAEGFKEAISDWWFGTWIFMTFHSVGNGKIIPTDFNSKIFQRGSLKPPTRLWLIIINHIITIINHYYWPSLLLLLPEYTTNQYHILNQRENLSSKKDFASKGLLLSSPCAEVHRTAVVMLRVLPSHLVLKWFGTWKSREKIIEKKNYDG
jgi:hypothetical protein